MCKCGETWSLQARAFDIFGAGARESERLDSLGESKPASVDDRFSGVDTSIAAGVSVMLRGNWRWRGKRRKNVGKGRVGFFLPVIRLHQGLCTPTDRMCQFRGKFPIYMR